MNDENKITRRQVVAGLGTTLAAVAVSPALAATGIEHSAETGTTRISDPRPLYPKPPFKSQPQPWPGLQSKMTRYPIAVRTATKVQAGSWDAKHLLPAVILVWDARLRLLMRAKAPTSQ